MNDTTLQLTGNETGAQLDQLTAAFEGLPEGKSMEVVSANDPSALLPPFQDRFWGAFDWYPLENGPEQWRVYLRRVPEVRRNRGLKEFMSTDHTRCDELYAEAENAARAGDAAATRRLFQSFETGMVHHFGMEENGFFPAFEQATGMTQGPTMVMRMEHRQMLGIISQMSQALKQEDLQAWLRGGSTLMVLMRQHNIKEEQMLYPMGEMHLGGVDGLLRAMQKTL
ncbi:MAG: hemerythrin domain-containing protein [Magnetococcales bacterium]|nr:hemerythrin domain-containing protein [Magnetococcales bacterium]